MHSREQKTSLTLFAWQVNRITATPQTPQAIVTFDDWDERLRQETLGKREVPSVAEVGETAVVATDDVVCPVPSDMKGSVIVVVHDEVLDDLRAERVIRERVGHNRGASNRGGPVSPLAVHHDLGVF